MQDPWTGCQFVAEKVKVNIHTQVRGQLIVTKLHLFWHEQQLNFVSLPIFGEECWVINVFTWTSVKSCDQKVQHEAPNVNTVGSNKLSCVSRKKSAVAREGRTRGESSNAPKMKRPLPFSPVNARTS